MNNYVKKNVYLVVALNEISWYTKDDVRERLSKLPLSYQYTIRKNMKPLARMCDEFNSFKAEQEQVLRDQWFDEEHSEETKTADENGNEIPARKIKDKYFPKYEKEIKKLNEQLEKLLIEQEEVNFITVNLDNLVDAAGDNSITMDDLDMISLFEEAEKTENTESDE